MDQDSDPVTHLNVKSIVEGHLKANPDLLDSSKDKDILVFLGNTGAGKSTLINYLSGKKLTVNNLNNIILENPADTSALTIGEGSNSETFLPRFMQEGDLMFYDLPGFKDTRGIATNLVNACFIKSIIENARSVGFVFVVGIDQLTCNRGESFKTLLGQIKRFFPGKSIENFSALVMTKSYLPQDSLSTFFETNLDIEKNPDLAIMRHWLSKQKVGQMLRPTSKVINQEDKVNILNIIRSVEREKIESIFYVYDISEQLKVNAIYNAEMEDIIRQLFEEHFQANIFPTLDKKHLEDKKNYLLNEFQKRIFMSIENSPLIQLLRPISEDLYQSSLIHKSEDLTERLNSIARLIDRQIAEKETQEAEAKRILAEQDAAHWQRKAAEAEKKKKERRERSIWEKIWDEITKPFT